MMPSADDWCTTPLTLVNKAFKAHLADGGNEWPSSVEKTFMEKVATLPVRNIVSINETPNHMLLDGQIARFRGMIQDMFDTEMFTDQYEVKDLGSGRIRLETSRYRDTASLGPRDEMLTDSKATKSAERMSYYCVSIPGEAPWAKDYYGKQSVVACNASGSEVSRAKRGRDDDDDDDDDNNVDMEDGGEKMDVDPTDAAKKPKAQSSSAKTASVESTNEAILNLPIAHSRGQAAIVKLYNVADGTFSLNDTVEFVGILSMDPALANLPSDIDANDVAAQFGRQESAAKNPPPSLIPRLHVVHYEKLAHNNPVLPAEVGLAQKAAVFKELRRSRDDLHGIFAELFFGDVLVADYLLCHLVSQVYLRKDVLCLGKMTLNLFNVPSAGMFAKRLATIVQLLVTKSHFFPLTVDGLNKTAFVPKKDYRANRLLSGMLQLSANTHLVVDETAMGNGQLTADGLKNLTALGSMIRWQRLDYDFNYHQIGFDTDIPCLVLSEGRSMLPQDVQLMVTKIDGDVDAKFSQVGSALLNEPGLLSRLRNYLTLSRLRDFDLSDEMQAFIQEDFVRERHNNANNLTGDDLHALLVLARLLALSRGEGTLTRNIWDDAKTMEVRRKQRMAHLPPRQQI